MEVEKLSPFGVKLSNLSKTDLLTTSIEWLEGLLSHHGVLLIDDVSFSAAELKLFCEGFSAIEMTDPFKSEDGVIGVLRVTNEKDSLGQAKGIFGESSFLGWHANRASSRDRKSIVCTYSSEGCDQSETWWASTDLLLRSLDVETLDHLSKIKGYFGYRPGSYTREVYKPHKNRQAWPLIFERYQRDILYFPFNQIVSYEGGESLDHEDSLVNRLEKLIVADPFVYRHRWSGHQIVLSDQWTTIHCRPPCQMEGRKILRTSFNYSNDSFPFAEKQC